MKNLFRIFSVLCVSALLLSSGIATAQDLTIENYTLISKLRVGRTDYNYIYKADVTNSGADIQNVTAILTSNSPNTTVVDGDLNFGDVGSGSSVTSIDTFTIKQNRSYPLNWSDLVWDVQYATEFQVELGTPQSNPKSFFYDEATNVIVNLSIASEQGVNVSGVTLLKTDSSGNIVESLGNMFDNGDVSNGDDIASDGVYSVKQFFQESIPGDIKLRISVEATKDGINVIKYSEVFILEALGHISDEDYSVALSIPDDAKDKYDEFLNDYGEDQALTKTVEWLEEKPEIGKAGVSESGKGIWWVYESGILGGMFIAPEGTRGNVGSKNTIGLSPFYTQFTAWGGDDADFAYKAVKYSECPSFNCTGPLKNASATVEKFKNLSDYGIVVIASHGDNWYNGILSWWQDKWGDDIDFFENFFSQVVVLTATEATNANKHTYEKDLKKHRLAITPGGKLSILPSFIIHHNAAFPDSIISMGSCRSLYNDTMANAFIAKGANTYFGFSDYVNNTYAYKSSNTLFEYLLEGKTTKEAFDQTIIDEGAYGPNGAYFRMKGDNNLTIAEFGIDNGGFEDGLTGWIDSGDVRVIPMLGPLSPTEGSYMAIISTGLGSVNDSNSEVYQSFCIGNEPTNISFDYNVVSEEPMEWVGTQYDDKFTVVLVMADGSQTQLAFESVNSSSWQSVSGIDFFGGDDTTYMTGWKHVDIDISALPDAKAIIFKTNTWDVGDSLWDTAALVDNIQLYKQ